jgi:hypothetical protein
MERRTPQQKDPQNYSRPTGAEQLLDQTRHAGKGDVSKPTVGVTPHPEKGAYDEKCGKSGLSRPSSGPTDRGKDPANMSKPHGGDEPIPKESLDRAKNKKKIEPKPAGKYLTGESTLKTSHQGE